jgi:hypothetical protein
MHPPSSRRIHPPQQCPAPPGAPGGWPTTSQRRFSSYTTTQPSPPDRTIIAHLSQKDVSTSTSARPQKNERASPAVQIVVNAATEALRLFSGGASQSTPCLPPGPSQPLAPNDIAGVMNVLREDYVDRAYFVTGVISDGIYDEDCRFVDPTIAFQGRELWKRNLRLLVPFLVNPSIELRSIEQLSEGSAESGAVLRAAWALNCGLRLPWGPQVAVNGTTTYTLASPENNRIVEHVETWDISGLEALLMVFTPGGG